MPIIPITHPLGQGFPALPFQQSWLRRSPGNVSEQKDTAFHLKWKHSDENNTMVEPGWRWVVLPYLLTTKEGVCRKAVRIFSLHVKRCQMGEHYMESLISSIIRSPCSLQPSDDLDFF